MNNFYSRIARSTSTLPGASKKIKYLYSFLLVCALFVAKANAQVTLDASNPSWQPATLVQGGAPGTFTVAVKNSTTSALTGAVLKITLPAGMEYVASSITGATEKSIANLNAPTFNVPTIAAGYPNDINFAVRINCGYVASGALLQYQLSDAGGTVITNTTGNNAANTPAPAYVFSTAPAPQALNVQLNTNGTRTIKIKNTGNVSVTTMYLESDVVTASQLPAYKVISADNGTLSTVSGGYLVTLTGTALKNAITTGNGDSSFDPGEELTIILTEQILTCILGSPVNLTFKAGSSDTKGSFCYAATNTASIAAIVGDPAISLSRITASTIWPDFCNVGKVSYIIGNTGTATYGAAANLYKIKLPWSTFTTDATQANPTEPSSIRITKVSINGTDVTSLVLKRNQSTTPYLIPTGATANCWVIDLGGLTQAYGTSLQDLNSDGKFDDLAPGKTVQLDFEYAWNLSNAQSCTLNSWGVPNDQNGRFSLGTYFQNQCGSATLKVNYNSSTKGSDGITYPNFQVGYQNNNNKTVSLDNLVLSPGDKTNLNIGILGNLVGLFAQSGITLKTFTFVLPDGLDYDPTGTARYFGSSSFNLASSSIFPAAAISYNAVTKTLTLTPDIAQTYVASSLNDFLKIPVIASSVASVSNKTVHFEASIGFVGCAITAKYGCNDVPLNYVLLGGNCATVSTKAFGLIRQTFGFIPDASGNNVWYKPIGFVNENTTGINLKGAVSKDKVKVSFSGGVNGTGFTELWARIKYTSTGTASATCFDPISAIATDVAGLLTVKKGSDGSTVSTNLYVSDVVFSYDAANSLQVQQANIGSKIGTGKAIDYTLATGDSVFVNWMVKVSRDNPSYTYSQLPNLAGDLYTKDAAGIETGCQALPDAFYVQRLTRTANGYVGITANYGSAGVNIPGSIINYNSVNDITGDHFPYEVRNYAHYRNITWTIPGIWQQNSGVIPVLTGNGVTTAYNLNWNMFNISYSGGNTIVTFSDVAWGSNGLPLATANVPVVSDFIGANGNYTIRLNMLPVCKTTGNVTATVSATVDDYTTAQDNSNTESYTYNYTMGNTGYNYTAYSATTAPLLQNIDGISKTATWPIQITNTSDKASMTAAGVNPNLPYNWISITAPHGNVQVTSVMDVATGISYPAVSYGTGKYWAQLGSVANTSTFNIVATYSTCATDSVYYTSGFSPNAYPIDPDQGFAPNAPACTNGGSWLRLYPKDAALTMTVSSPANPVEFCTNADGNAINYTLTVTNTATADANNLVMEAKFPVGYTAKPGTSTVTYNGVTKTIADPVYNSAKGVWQWRISADASNVIDSLPGATGMAINSFVLKYRGATQCGFTSGTSVTYTITSQTGCGAERDYEAAGSAMTLSIVPASLNSYFITPANISLNTSGNTATYTASIINQGSSTLGNSESVILNLPAGVDIVAGSVVPVTNAGNITGIVSNAVNGTTRTLTFKLPMGASGISLSSGEAAAFKFDLKIADASLLTCGTFPGVLDASTVFAVTSNCSGTPCTINFITGHTTSDLTITKATVTPTVTAASVAGNNVTAQYTLTNSGAIATTTATTVDFFLDANSNGVYDAGESIYNTQSVTGNLAAGTTSTVQTVTFTVPAGTLPCSILAAVRSAVNPQLCSDAYMALPCNAALTIKKTTSATNVKAGDNVTFTLSITNNGTKDTTGVQIKDTPQGFTYVSSTGAGTYNGNVWTVDVAHGVTQTINIVMTAAATGPYSNVIAGNGDNPTNPVITPDTAKFAALSIKKTTSATNVKAGDNVTFTLSITNNGTKDTTGVQIKDTPQGFTYVSSTGAGTYSGNVWTVDVAHGATQMINVVMTAAATGPYSNIITGNNDDPANPTILPDTARFAVLTIKKTTSTTNVKAGDNVTFTLSITNNGTKDTTGVQIKDTPQGFTYVSSTGAGTYSGNIWTVDVAHGATQTINVVMTAAVTGPYSNVIAGNGDDPTNPVIAPDTAKFVAISIKKTTSATNVKAGDNVTFTLSVTNSGTKDTTGVQIKDIPTGFSYVSNNGATGGTYNASTNVWTVDVAHGATQTINVVMKAAATGPYSNIAVGGNHDPSDPTNPVDTAKFSAISIKKTTSATNVKAGDNVTFTLSIMNSGTKDTTGVQIKDTPQGFTYVSSDGAGTYSGNVWTVDVAKGTTQTINVVMTAAATGPYSNIITGNNDDPANPTILPDTARFAALTIKKTTSATNVKAGDNVTFTLSITNSGTKDTTSVQIKDTPQGFIYVSSTGAGAYSGNIWTVDVAHGATQTINVVMTAAAAGPYSNVITGNNDDPANPTILPDTAKFAAISVKKTTSATNVRAGNNVTFTISVTNSGTKDTTGVQIKDIPTGFTYVSNNSATAGTYDGITNVWAVDVAHGVTQSINIVMQAAATGPYSNIVVGGNDDPHDPANPVDTAQFAAISVKKTTNATNVKAGDNVTFTLSVTNSGTKDTTGVKIKDIPTGFSYVSNNGATGGTYNAATNEWIVDVAHGATQNINVIMKAAATGPYGNVVIGGNDDPQDPTTPVDTAKFVSIMTVKSVQDANNNGKAEAGEILTYTIKVHNAGTAEATNIVVTDVVPAHTTYVAGSGGALAGNTVTFTDNSLPANASHSYSFQVKVDTDLTGVTSISNIAMAVVDNADPVPTAKEDPNNPGMPDPSCTNPSGCPTDISTNGIKSFVTLKSVTDANGDHKAQAGEELTYTIKVINTGSVRLDNITVSDAVPAHTTYVTGSGGTLTGNTVSFTGVSLAVHTTATYSFKVKVVDDITGIGSSIANTATVIADTIPATPTKPEDPANPGQPDPACINPSGCPTVLPVDDNIIGVKPVCVNSTVTLTNAVSGGVWSSNNTGIAQINANTGIVTGISAGTAKISYTVNGKTVTADVTVNPLPVVPAITGNTDICITGGGTLNNTVANGAWSSVNTGVVTIDANNGTMTSVSAGTSIIKYTVTDVNTKCQATVQTDVTVYPMPVVPAITGKLQVCEASFVVLSNVVSDGIWSSSDNTIATVDANGKVTGMGYGNVEISYTVTNAGSCTTTVKATVTVNNKPAVVTTAIAAVCSPNTVDLRTGISNYDANNYTYTFTDAAGIVVANPAAVSAAGIYTVVAENKTNYCGSASQTLQVKINPKPLVNVVTFTPGEVCAPSTVNIQSLIANYDATTYNYSYTDQYGNAVATPTAISASGSYNITATDKVNDTHCSSQPVTVVVTVNPQPVITVVNNGNMTLCGNTGTVDLTTGISNYNAGYTYTYTDAGGNPLSNVSAIGTPGTYYVTAKDNKCFSVKTAITLTHYATPVVTITDPAAVYDPYIVDITTPAVTAGSTADLTYAYYNSNNQQISSAQAKEISGPGSYTYYLQGTSAEGCKSNTAPVHVLIKERPVLSISSAEIWEGQKATLTLSLPTGVTMPDAIPVKLITQRPGSTIMEGDYGKPDMVTLQANTNNVTFVINTWDNNVLDLDRLLILGGGNTIYNVTPGTVLIHDSTSLKPQNLIITIGRDTIYGRGTGAVSVSLPIGISTSYPIPVSVYPASGTTINSSDYTMTGIVTIPAGSGASALQVTVTNLANEDRKLNLSGQSTGFVVKDGGVYIRQSRINVVPLVSDNGDGINDFLKIEGIEKYTSKMGGSNKVVLFNRWEDVIYETGNYDNSAIKFDGRGNKHGAGRVPDGVYFYVITITIPDNDLGIGEPKTQTFKGYFRLQK
ncbi:MAG: DUF11 domain-containing protein [Filimonas sp.]|nr:DUF11 domain-containing protein [Filimonas sp.]